MRILSQAVSLFAIALFLYGCVTSPSKNIDRNTPEFVQGYEMGIEFAEKHRIALDCSEAWLGTQGTKKAKTYVPK